MSRFVGLALMAGGIILVVLGFQAKDSFASEMKEVIDGTPTDETIWYFVGGTILIILGAGLAIFKRRPRGG